jgi:glycosyltransferase involved in cell wall biosynthesis
MKVALVHDYLREYGGAERVLDVLHEMYPDATVFTSYYFPQDMPEHYKNWDIRTSFLQKMPFVHSFHLLYTYLLPYAFEQFDLHEYDLVISSASFAAKGVITHPNQKHICYCHTPPRFLWGLNTQTKRRGLLKNIARLPDRFFRKWDLAAAQRVDSYIANSRTTQKRIKDIYGCDSEVIYPPCIDQTKINTHATPLSEGYFLALSRLYRTKHVDLIIETFNELGLPLIIVGTGSEENHLRALAKPNISFRGYVSDEEREKLYAECRALVTASENEDFGMTIPEVAAYGKSVIAYRSGGHLESVVERKTGVFFDDLTVESMTTAIREFEVLLFDHVTIKEHAVKFSVQEFKRKFEEFVRKISKNSTSS